jgi:hypothetical protein
MDPNPVPDTGLNETTKTIFRKHLAENLFWSDPEPDPEVFKSRISIRSKIVRISNTGFMYS